LKPYWCHPVTSFLDRCISSLLISYSFLLVASCSYSEDLYVGHLAIIQLRNPPARNYRGHIEASLFSLKSDKATTYIIHVSGLFLEEGQNICTWSHTQALSKLISTQVSLIVSDQTTDYVLGSKSEALGKERERNYLFQNVWVLFVCLFLILSSFKRRDLSLKEWQVNKLKSFGQNNFEYSVTFVPDNSALCVCVCKCVNIIIKVAKWVNSDVHLSSSLTWESSRVT
jgi:hypothetical protein